MPPVIAFIGTPGPMEILVILTIGLLLFGSRLPEVGRSLGKGLLEFRKGMQGIKDEVYGLEREADVRVDEEVRRRERERERSATVEVEPGVDDLDPIDEELALRERERRAVEPEPYRVEDDEPEIGEGEEEVEAAPERDEAAVRAERGIACPDGEGGAAEARAPDGDDPDLDERRAEEGTERDRPHS